MNKIHLTRKDFKTHFENSYYVLKKDIYNGTDWLKSDANIYKMTDIEISFNRHNEYGGCNYKIEIELIEFRGVVSNLIFYVDLNEKSVHFDALVWLNTVFHKINIYA